MSTLSATPPTHRRNDALLAWVNELELSSDNGPYDPLTSIEDCYDPSLLVAACRTVDDAFFDSVLQDDDEMLDAEERLQVLKRLVEAITNYYGIVLSQKTEELDGIDLESISTKSSSQAIADLLVIILSMAVLSPDKENQISKIQGTPQWVQKELMLCIEQVRNKLPSPDPVADIASFGVNEESADSLASYMELHAAHRTLQTTHSQLQQELEALKEEHEQTVASLRTANSPSKARRTETDAKADAALRAEIDRLQSELAKAEHIILEAEQTSSKHEKTVEELTKKVDELSVKAEQADKLHDEMDEHRHASEKLRKLEGTVDKYKKKLEEGAEAKRLLKNLEEENISLLDKNSQLEQENQEITQFKELMASYKGQISALEGQNVSLQKEKEAAQLKADAAERRSSEATEKQLKQEEMVNLLEDRLKELEGRKATGDPTKIDSQRGATSDDSESENELSGIANELDDAATGLTTTELKLQIRRLKRELEVVQQNKADSSRIIVLENLLEDAQRLKTRYEHDFLNEHKEKLLLARQLEEIRDGSSTSSNDAEASIALRLRLGETFDELDALRKKEIGLSNDLMAAQKQLLVLKSDISLVNSDQLTILAELRATVSKEKEGLEQQVVNLTSELKKAQDTATMHLSQINGLLLDKVDLQSRGLQQRELMLERERDRSTSVSSQNTHGLGVDASIVKLELRQKEEELEKVKDQLKKARNFIRQQDKLFKEQHKAQTEAANGDQQAVINSLEADIIKQKALNAEIEQKYQKEQRLLTVAYQDANLERLRSQVLTIGHTASRPAPASWLAQQRARALHYL